MSANETQVGGSHYKGGSFQHWDLMARTVGVGYHMGNATKYLVRWRDKNGVEDLKKTRHYMIKIRELAELGHANHATPLGRVALREFLAQQKQMTGDEKLIFYIIMTWIDITDLDPAIRILDKLIEKEREPMRTADFFAYARARQDIKLARDERLPAPWTTDPILRTYRFCNVYREDDKVTRWFAKNVRRKIKTLPELMFACVAFRMFNQITTAQALLDAGAFTDFKVGKAWKAIKDIRPVVNGAYIIVGKTGMPKGRGILEVLKPIWRDRVKLTREIMDTNTLQHATSLIGAYERLGPFLAYEAVTDMRHTPLLNRATDIMTWCNPGPGAARGLSRLVGMDKGHFNRNSKRDHETMMDLMGILLNASKLPENWPKDWPSWELRDVEHTLCEFDKYERARLGEGRPKQKYRPEKCCEAC